MARVTIIVAAYGRPSALRNAIRAARAQTMDDWSMLVIGDCCADDSEAVVLAFEDPRISFLNLPERFGEQAGPNSVGMALADNEYIAFLNQDDLWLPNYLEQAMNALETADLYWSRAAFFGNRGPRADAAIFTEAHPENRTLEGACNGPRHYAEPMSSWAMRASLAREIGPMRLSSQIATVPINDYVFRLWQRKPRFVSGGEISVLKDKMHLPQLGARNALPHYTLPPTYAEVWLEKIESRRSDLLLEDIEEDIWLAGHLGLSRQWKASDPNTRLPRTDFYLQTGIDPQEASLLAAGSPEEPGMVLSKALHNRTGESITVQPSLDEVITAVKAQRHAG